MIDLQRRAVSERNLVEHTDFTVESGDEGWLDDLFDETGHWRVAPAAWGDPEAAYERKLSPAESQALTYHLDRCLMCRNFDSQLRFLHAAAERFRSGTG